MAKWKTTAAAAATFTAVAGPATAQVPGAQLSVARTPAARTSVMQLWPDRVMKAVVSSAAGGPIDITSRIVTKRLGELLGHTVIVENRPGAAGMVAYRAVAAAEPDGHTLLIGNTSALAVLPTIARTGEVEGLKRLTPVAKLVEGYEVMVVAPASPATTLPAFIAYAKAHPGALNYGSVGFGNLTHVAGELLKQKTGIGMRHVPYRGQPELIAGLMSGQVQMNFTDVAGALPLAREGKVCALAISSAARDPRAPDIATFIEQGVPDFVVQTFMGVMAPAATPPAIVAKLNEAINAALTDAETRATLEKLGTSVRPGTVEEFGAFLSAEQRRWEDVVAHAGIRG
jgi:tripartite-type tricarboxylate transporter receptor subunit TctC